MPGKVNPVIPKWSTRWLEVMGNDMTIACAAEAGQLQLNAFEPMIAYAMFRSLAPGHRRRVLDEKCARITANPERLREQLTIPLCWYGAESLHRVRERHASREGGAR